MADVTGVEGVVKNYNLFLKKSQEGLKKSLENEADIILNLSRQIVPTETGTLKSTGRRTDAKTEMGQVIVDMMYGGGPAADYAVIQHENLDYSHKMGEQAKFLEAPAKARAQNITIAAATEMIEVAEALTITHLSQSNL